MDEHSSLETPGRKDKDRSTPHNQPDDSFYHKKLTDAQKKLLAPAAEVEAAHRELLRH